MRLVLADGCFDLFHNGHLRHLQEAREMGTLLVVGVTKDEFVAKGTGRPIIGEADRLAMVGALGCVYHARLVKDSMEALHFWKPQIYVKGHEYTNHLLPEEINFCTQRGIEICYTKSSDISTTKLIERIKCVSS